MSEIIPNLDQKTRILIVDDSIQFAMVLNRLLTGIFGFTAITTLSSTEDALQRLESEPAEFGLVFLDFHFPSGMSGGELLTMMSEKGLLGDKIVFLMSSDPTAEALQRVLKSGAAGVIAKPFDRDELRRQLERASRLAHADEADSF